MRHRELITGLSLYVTLFSSLGRTTPEPGGFLQIRTTPGTKVTLAEQTPRIADEDGTTFRNVAPGIHRIVGHRPGYRPQFGWVEIFSEEVTIFQFDGWQPEPKTGQKKSGALMIRTFPVEATISAKKLGWQKIEISQKPFFASALPPGSYKLTLCNAYKCMDHRTNIHAHEVTTLFVDFEQNRIEDRTKHQKAHFSVGFVLVWIGTICGPAGMLAVLKHPSGETAALAPSVPPQCSPHHPKALP